MERVTLVRQYAKALFELCREKTLVDRVADALRELSRRIDAEPDAHSFLFHPEVPFDRKWVALQALLPEDMAPPATGLLDLLVRHRQLRLLPEIRAELLALRQASFGVLKARVETVRPLSDTARAGLQAALEKVTGHPVAIEEKLNPELIGGARIRIGDRIVDASIAGRLKRIQESLVKSVRLVSGASR
jgi:F-type H+-transporting ATPase subunit delta